MNDQDEALAFYAKKLGMEVRIDARMPEMGNFRWLTVGPIGQPDVSIVLMAIPSPLRGSNGGGAWARTDVRLPPVCPVRLRGCP